MRVYIELMSDVKINSAIFEAKKNLFGGCIVESSALLKEPEIFAANLEYSLKTWKEEGIKVVWLTIPKDMAEFIPLCVASGFVFHHATENSLQMTLALIPDSTVPPYATHYIGAGGVVIDDKRRLLVVSERYKEMPGRRLKLPGGAVKEGEHIATAVVREVKEETGIDARFEYVVCMRHWHGYRYGKSDIYFICRLTPLSTQIYMDTNELAECLWMPLDEYLNDPDVHQFNKLAARTAAASESGLSERFISDYNKETHEVLVF